MLIQFFFFPFFCEVKGCGLESGWGKTFFFERLNQMQLKKKKATEKKDYSIFVYRIATLHDVFIMCTIFCSKQT